MAYVRKVIVNRRIYITGKYVHRTDHPQMGRGFLVIVYSLRVQQM